MIEAEPPQVLEQESTQTPVEFGGEGAITNPTNSESATMVDQRPGGEQGYQDALDYDPTDPGNKVEKVKEMNDELGKEQEETIGNCHGPIKTTNHTWKHGELKLMGAVANRESICNCWS